MKKRKKTSQPGAHPIAGDFAVLPQDPDDARDYLGFLSNGMTNNEHIDEFAYFDRHLTEETPEDDA